MGVLDSFHFISFWIIFVAKQTLKKMESPTKTTEKEGSASSTLSIYFTHVYINVNTPY